MEQPPFGAFAGQVRYPAGSHFINPVCGHVDCIYTVSHHHCSQCGYGSTEVDQQKGHTCQRPYGSEYHPPPPPGPFYQAPPPAGFYPPPPHRLRPEDRPEYGGEYAGSAFLPAAPMLGPQYFPPPPPGAPASFYPPVYRAVDPQLSAAAAPLDFSERRPASPAPSSSHHHVDASSDRAHQSSSSLSQCSALYPHQLWTPTAHAQETHGVARNHGDDAARCHGDDTGTTAADQERLSCMGWPAGSYGYGEVVEPSGFRGTPHSWIPPVERGAVDPQSGGRTDVERPSCQMQERPIPILHQPLPLLPQQMEERTPVTAAVAPSIPAELRPPAPPINLSVLPPIQTAPASLNHEPQLTEPIQDITTSTLQASAFRNGGELVSESSETQIADNNISASMVMSSSNDPKKDSPAKGNSYSQVAPPRNASADQELLAESDSNGKGNQPDNSAPGVPQNMTASENHQQSVQKEGEVFEDQSMEESDDEHVDSPAGLPSPQIVDSPSSNSEAESTSSGRRSAPARPSSGEDTSLSPINVDIQVNCLICSTLINLQTDQYCDIYLDNIATAHSRLPVSEKLGLVLRYHFSPELLHSHTLCRRCFNIINGIDQLEGRLDKLRSEVRHKFSQTCADRGLAGDHFPSRDPEESTPVPAEAAHLPTMVGRLVQTSPIPEPWQCSVCQMSFRFQSDLRRHSTRHREPRVVIPCSRCSRVFTSRDSLRRHRIRAHATVLNCAACRSVFESRAALLAHVCAKKDVIIAEDRSSRTCDTCGKIFTQKRNLTAHKKRCGDTESFICASCGAEAVGRANYEKHVAKHRQGHPHVCATCDRGFYKPSDFKRHLKTHDKEKSHVCETCGKQFSTKANYNQHMAKVHEARRSFKCSLCPKSFSYKSSVDIHMKSHDGVKSFKCDQCGRKFVYKNNLVRHLRLHDRVQKCKCDNCDMVFGKKAALKSHSLTCF